jgi:cell division protein FtsN
MVTAVKRKKSRRRTRGGTLLGIMVGLLAGLVVAVAAALYMTRSSVPFMDRTRRAPPPASAVEPGKASELPDPNRGTQKGRVPPGEAPPPLAAPATPPGAPGAPGTPGSVPPPVATAPPSVPPASGSAAPPDTPADRSVYLLQAGAFKGQEDAEGMKVKLALIGFEARIVTAEVNGVTFYRVRVGPYGQLDDMNRARTRLAENGIEASVVRQR